MHSLANFVLRRSHLVALTIAGILIASAVLIPRVKFMPGMEDFYDRKHPQQQVMDALEEHFVGDRWVFIPYETDDVFSRKSLVAVRKLSEDIDNIELKRGETTLRPIEDIMSLATLKDAYGGNGMFRSDLLLPDPIPTDRSVGARVRARARGNPVIWDNFVGDGGRVAGIAVRLSPRSTLSDTDRKTTIDTLRALLAKTQKESQIRFYLTGLPVIETDIPYVALNDTLLGAALMFVLIGLIIFASLRKFRGLLLVVGIVSAASLAGLAMIPATGGTYNPISSLMLPILAALCVATTMHFLVESGTEMRLHPDRDVRPHVYSTVLRPAMFTIVTTSIGFASLGLSQTRSVSIFGWATAAALLVGGLLTLLIIGLAWGRKPASYWVGTNGLATGHRFDAILTRFANFVIRRKRSLTIVAGALIVICGIGATRIKTGESNVDYFRKSMPVRKGADFMTEHLGGSNSFIISVRANKENIFLEPKQLRLLAGLQKEMKDNGDAGRVMSIVDFLRVMNRAFHGEQDEYHRLPATRQQVAQLLMMNTNDRVAEFIDDDRQWVRIYVRTPTHNTGAMAGVFKRTERRLKALFPPEQGFETHVTGDSRIFGLNFEYVTTTQTTSLLVAGLVILVLMSFMFRSVTVALFSMVPNMLPILTIFGVMGWLGIELSISTALISAVTLGIAVDDTIHFIQQYRTSLAEHGDIERAVRETFRIKGAAIIWSSVIFSLGFLVFMVADFTPFHLFAALSSMAMGMAVVGDLMFLPAFLLLTRSRLGVKTGADESSLVRKQYLSAPALDSTIGSGGTP